MPTVAKHEMQDKRNEVESIEIHDFIKEKIWFKKHSVRNVFIGPERVLKRPGNISESR